MDKINLLLVEDSDTDAHFALRIFKKEIETHNFKWLPDGEQAIEFLMNVSEQDMPDLVLLDLKIPKVSGMNVLKHIRENKDFAKLPVIIYSSSGEKSDIEAAYAIGANSFLTKPNDYKRMKEVLGTAYRYWINFNQK